MRKTILTLAAIFGLSVAGSYAQTLSLDVKAEANLSGYYLSRMNGTEIKIRTGSTLGGFMKWEIANYIALQPELLFHYNSYGCRSPQCFDENAQCKRWCWLSVLNILRLVETAAYFCPLHTLPSPLMRFRIMTVVSRGV